MHKTVYGLGTCDNTKATLRWLKANKIPFSFHDFKTEGVQETKLQEWLQQVPMEKLLNKKSTTWRSLTSQQQENAVTEKQAVKLMQEYSSLIKRPVIESDGKLESVGVIPGRDKK